MKNVMILLCGLALPLFSGAQDLYDGNCEIVQESYFWKVDPHNGQPAAKIFPDLASALAERNHLVETSQCKLPAANAAPECQILAQYGYFYVKNGQQQAGQLVSNTIEGAQAIRDQLIKDGSCVLPAQVPKCSHRQEYSFWIVLQGDHDTGTGYPSEDAAVQFQNKLAGLGVCN